MKRLLLALSLFFAIPVSASEITSKIVDSVQLTVQGAAVQSTRIGASYGVSGTNITCYWSLWWHWLVLEPMT
jgi:hypothetical protein